MDLIAKLIITWILVFVLIVGFGVWEINQWEKEGYGKDYNIRWWSIGIWVSIPVIIGFVYMWMS